MTLLQPLQVTEIAILGNSLRADNDKNWALMKILILPAWVNQPYSLKDCDLYYRQWAR